jgi:hypothetical protein
MYELCLWFFCMACMILCIWFFFSFLCHVFHLVRKNGLCSFYVLHGILDFMSMTLSLCISLTNKEWFTFFLLYPMLDSMSCIIIFPFFTTWAVDLLLGLAQMGCCAHLENKKQQKKHHNLIPSLATLSHTHSEHSSPRAPTCCPKPACLLKIRPDSAVPPSHRPRSVY